MPSGAISRTIKLLKMIEIVGAIIVMSWLVFSQRASYLLFGFLAAGVLLVIITSEWVERHLGTPGIGPVLKASLFGVPLPLCSCSVIPVQGSTSATAQTVVGATPRDEASLKWFAKGLS